MTEIQEIKIHDTASRTLVGHEEILSVVDAWASRLRWVMKDIYGAGDITAVWPDGFVALEKNVKKSASGVPFSWAQIRELMTLVDYVDTLRLEGHAEETLIEIEVFDSTYWRIASTEQELVDELERRFSVTERTRT
ncbi:MAG: hypothetical protein ACYDHO_01630 [Gaiellaceae bacterium]